MRKPARTYVKYLFFINNLKTNIYKLTIHHYFVIRPLKQEAVLEWINKI